MAENVITDPALIDVSDRSKNEVPENEVPGTEVPENDVNSGSCTVEVQKEPEWYRDGDAWVKLFLEPIAPGKFKQHDYIYNVPGENEFPIKRWSSAACRDGFHITRRRDVQFHLALHNYKSAYIAEVVSHGEEFYDNTDGYKRKVRVVTFGPAVPLAYVLGKHPNDFKHGQMLVWSLRNNHLELVKLTGSKNQDNYFYSYAFIIALKNGNDQIADFLFENCENDAARHVMLINTIHYGRVDLVKRLMENIPVNVSFFKTACRNGQFEIFQLLCAKYGEPKCSDIIFDALRGGNVKILYYIKTRGVDMSDFELFVYACNDYESNVETVKYLVSEGANVNHPLIAYIVKRRACDDDDNDVDDDVREYLLDYIDYKSEVPGCETLEDEIDEICDTFYNRVEAGEFDRL
jgi:hypothetical protein